MSREPHWLMEEIKTAHFGDRRLTKRFGHVLNHFMHSPNKSIPGTFKSWKETLAAYRFFNHAHVSDTDILLPHHEATLERIRQEKIVLIPQDTTEIDFTGRKSMEGMGYLSQEKSQGFYLHPSLALTPERSCLGVVQAQSWVREALGKSKSRKSKPIEEKESVCWLKGYEAANEIAHKAEGTLIVSIADREGDIYELLEKMPSELNKAYWLVRCQHNRMLFSEGEKALEQRLWETVRATSPIGEIAFQLPPGKIYNRDKKKRTPRAERTVRQAVRSSTVTINVPKVKKRKSTPITLHVVHCCEIDAPNEADKIEWFLLTSFPVTDANSAIEVVNWYLCRWMIELFFKILKSGCQVEELQFETLKATKNCIALYLIVAWRILYLTMIGRQCPTIDCNLVFEEAEWQSVFMIMNKKPPPSKPPTLNEMILMIAKLGGFLGRKLDGYPGPKVIWIGIQRMKDFTLAWETFQPLIKRQTYV